MFSHCVCSNVPESFILDYLLGSCSNHVLTNGEKASLILWVRFTMLFRCLRYSVIYVIPLFMLFRCLRYSVIMRRFTCYYAGGKSSLLSHRDKSPLGFFVLTV